MKIIIIWLRFTEVCSWGFSWQCNVISGYLCQAITWISDYLVPWRHMKSLGYNELILDIIAVWGINHLPLCLQMSKSTGNFLTLSDAVKLFSADGKLHSLTQWGRNKIVAISQTFSNSFSWMKMYEFRLIFCWNLFLKVWLTIFQHWFR